MATVLLDCELVAQIRLIEHATGRNDMFSEFVRKLEGSLAGFGAAFSDCIACGDTKGAERAAHTLKGICLQLGARDTDFDKLQIDVWTNGAISAQDAIFPLALVGAS